MKVPTDDYLSQLTIYIETSLIKKEKKFLRLNLWSLGYKDLFESLHENTSEIQEKGLITYSDSIINSKVCKRIKRLKKRHPFESFLFLRNLKNFIFELTFPIWGKINILINNYNKQKQNLSPELYLQTLLYQKEMLNISESRFEKDYINNKQEDYEKFLSREIEITKNRIITNNEPKEIDLQHQIRFILDEQLLSSFCLDFVQAGFVEDPLELKKIFSFNEMVAHDISSAKKIRWQYSLASLRLCFEWMIMGQMVPRGLGEKINIRLSMLFLDKKGNDFTNKQIGTSYSKRLDGFKKNSSDEMTNPQFLSNKETTLLEIIKKHSPNWKA